MPDLTLTDPTTLPVGDSATDANATPQLQDPTISPPVVPPATPVIQTTGQSTPVEQTGPLSLADYTAATVTNNAKQKQATEDETAARRRLAQDTVDVDTGAVNEAQAHVVDQAKNLDALSKLVQQHNTQDYADLDALHKQNEARDPNHWWNSRTTGQKLQAGIGIILGGLGQGLQQYGGAKNATNSALDIIDNTIKQDIELQDSKLKENFQEYAQKHGIRQNEENFQKYAMTSKELQHMNAQQVFKNQLALATAKAADPIAKANGDAALATLDQQDATQRRGLGQWLETQGAAAQARLAAYQKDQLERERALEDKRLAGAQALELEGVKAAATAQQKSSDEKQKTTDKSLEGIDAARTLILSAREAAKNGDKPDPAAITAAAKLGIVIPKTVDHWYNLTGEKDVDKAYQSALDILEAKERRVRETAPAPTTVLTPGKSSGPITDPSQL